MHPIHTVLDLSVVPMHLREIFREHLAWIGGVMGIGQAGLLADVSIRLVWRMDGLVNSVRKGQVCLEGME